MDPHSARVYAGLGGCLVRGSGCAEAVPALQGRWSGEPGRKGIRPLRVEALWESGRHGETRHEAKQCVREAEALPAALAERLAAALGDSR